MPTFMKFRSALALLLCATALPTQAAIIAQQLVTGFSAPTFLTAPADGTNRLFVTERAGRIKIFQMDVSGTTGTVLATNFLNITGVVNTTGEGGLLSMALHPQYNSNGRFFVYYTNAAGNLVTAEYRRSSGNSNLADAATTTIITINHPTNSNHNGGQIAFGPDGYLYLAPGDGGGSNDPNGNGQNINTLLGKVLRLDIDSAVNSTPPYASPATNPFVGQAGSDEIYAYGVRNPYRFSFDRSDGRLFLGDVGQGTWEEVNIITNGANYGWNTMEGNVCFPIGSTTCNMTGKTLPIHVYNHSAGNFSITGGYVYRGTQMPSQIGHYIFGDYGSGRIWSLNQTGPTTWAVTPLLQLGGFNVTGLASFGEDANAELYALGLVDGIIYRLRDTTSVENHHLYD